MKTASAPSPKSPEFPPFQAKLHWLGALLFGVTLIAYLPAMSAGFIWNDSEYVTYPALRSWHGLWRIWFEVGATEQYYPLLHSAFWLEHRLWGDATLGYHLANILLHAGSACLFGLILRRLKVPGAVLAAFLFALHPVCVESVAWISEQKNTLSTVFYLLAALTYLRWRSSSIPQGGMEPSEVPHGGTKEGKSPKSHKLYILATFWFVLALLSKSVTATLPAALLVIFWWQRGRLSWKTEVRPLIPWFAIGAVWGLFSAWVERTYIGAQGSRFDFTLPERGLIAGRAIWFYLGKLIWPADLIFIYPRWNVHEAEFWQYLFPLGAAAMVAGLWLMRKRSRGPLAAVLFFIGTLFPTLGFFNVYAFIFSFVADHWQYLSSLGILALAAASVSRFEKSVASLGSAFPLFRFLAVAVLAAMGLLTFQQSSRYNDIESFYAWTIERNPLCWMAHYNLGLIQLKTGRIPEAIGHFEEAIRINPRDADAHNNLALGLAAAGRLPEALAHHETAVRIKPDSALLHNNLGDDLADAGRLPEAIAQYEEALRLKPDSPEFEYDLGNALARSGRVPEAIAHYGNALRLNPNYAEARANLGMALANSGRLPEAVVQFQEALRLNPDYAVVHNNLGQVLQAMGRAQEAEVQFQEAARLQAEPAHP